MIIEENGKALRYNRGKAGWHLLPYDALRVLVAVFDYGNAKYGPEAGGVERNWESGQAYSICYASLLRHLTAWWDGEANDVGTPARPGSGLPHLAHAVWNALALLTYTVRGIPNLDDRPTRPVPGKEFDAILCDIYPLASSVPPVAGLPIEKTAVQQVLSGEQQIREATGAWSPYGSPKIVTSEAVPENEMWSYQADADAVKRHRVKFGQGPPVVPTEEGLSRLLVAEAEELARQRRAEDPAVAEEIAAQIKAIRKRREAR